MDSAILVQNIKLYCKANGVPPTVACRESGAGKDFLTNVNKGQTPSIGKVQQLAAYLGCTVSDLLGEKRTDAPESVGLSPDEQALIDLFRRLPEDQQEAVVKIVQAAAAQQSL